MPIAIFSLPALMELKLDRNALSCDLPGSALGGGVALPAISRYGVRGLATSQREIVVCPLCRNDTAVLRHSDGNHVAIKL